MKRKKNDKSNVARQKEQRERERERGERERERGGGRERENRINASNCASILYEFIFYFPRCARYICVTRGLHFTAINPSR